MTASQTRRFRFGVMAGACASAREWTEQARRLEDLGYAVLCVPDHYTPQLATTPALAAAAAVTTSLRIGSLVYGVDFRHPALLAKEAATLDLLSDGRFELGIGAGWMDQDYDWPGIERDPPGRRIARMVEAIEIAKAFFAGEPVSYEGHEYRIDGLPGYPATVQRPHPPVLSGGGGRRILEAAARHADIVSVNPNVGAGRFDGAAWASVAAAMTDEKLEIVRSAAGARYSAVEICFLNFFTVVTEGVTAASEEVAKVMGLAPEAVLASPNTLVGTVDGLVEELQGRRERWDGSYIVVRSDAAEAFAPVVARLAGT